MKIMSEMVSIHPVIHKSSMTQVFKSLECEYNVLQFGIRINSIEVSKQTLCTSMALYVFNKTYSK